MLLIMVYASNDTAEWTVSYFFSNNSLLFWVNWVQSQGGVVLNQRFSKQATLRQVIKTESYNKPYMKKKKRNLQMEDISILQLVFTEQKLSDFSSIERALEEH